MPIEKSDFYKSFAAKAAKLTAHQPFCATFTRRIKARSDCLSISTLEH